MVFFLDLSELDLVFFVVEEVVDLVVFFFLLVEIDDPPSFIGIPLAKAEPLRKASLSSELNKSSTLELNELPK